MEDLPEPPLESASASLLDIGDQLVVRGKPTTSWPGKLDIDRCVALFNYLVAVGWMAYHGKGPEDLDELVKRPSYFDSSRGEKTRGLREKLEPQITEFLEKIVMPSAGEASVFFWVRALQDEDMLSHQELFNFAVLDDKEKEMEIEMEMEKGKEAARPRFIKLLDSAVGSGGGTMGVIYDQKRRRVAFPYFTKDVARFINGESHNWLPLEVLLSNWIHLLRIGKVVAEPAEPVEPEAAAREPGGAGERSGSGRKPVPTKLSVWRWCSYGAGQVWGAVDAYNGLISLIEFYMDPDWHMPVEKDEPLVSHAVLDAAGVPEKCFAREFLTQARKPRFAQIAPGLCVPRDAATFIARQRLTRTRAVLANPSLIPPVLMFYSPDGRRVLPKTRERALPQTWQRIGLVRGEHRADMDREGPIPAGLYSEAVDRDEVDNAEEGFRLLLPWRCGPLARYSDGKTISKLEKRSTSELYQHGFQRLGSMGYGRAQRLESLFKKWEVMVRSRQWCVNQHGVEGGLERFRGADDEMDWFWYCVQPSW
ncbi:hypothetical protein ESCO_003117 [Escovopsis weberi]|uniref:Uncharacterized protein n=1 Tax=Escovopsis weberi TaxID=150374 RepID=A0A0M9VSR2_ESCWE|nr:hypothetical protein ESCO_003117 [Escovopsis weberi]